MIVLDTDHLTVFRYSGSASYTQLFGRLNHSLDQDIRVSVISVEEQMRGWLKEIKGKFSQPLKQVPIYAELTQLLEFYHQWRVVPFDARAAAIYSDLRKRKLKAGMQDRKIAAIAIANNATLLSANLVHFEPITELSVEDWLH